MHEYEPDAFPSLWTPADIARKKQKPSNLGKILTTASPPLGPTKGLVLILLTGKPIEKSPILV